jgi:hypothetical protein
MLRRRCRSERASRARRHRVRLALHHRHDQQVHLASRGCHAHTHVRHAPSEFSGTSSREEEDDRAAPARETPWRRVRGEGEDEQTSAVPTTATIDALFACQRIAHVAGH